MVTSRIPFRARKPKPELQHGLVTRLVATSSDGASYRGKKRKLQQEEEAEMPNAVSTTTEALLSSATAIITKGGEESQTSTVVAKVMVTVTSLSEAGAIAAGIEHLKYCDFKLKGVIEASKLPSFQTCTGPFHSLARTIVYQQLASNAATAIYNRLLHLCGGESSFTPAVISQLPAPELRSIGISARKASYLHDLSRNFLEGGLSDASIMVMEDDKLMSALTAVKGIGVWSVHMFMIFALHRPDILPVGDLGVRKGFSKLYGLKALPTPADMEKLSESWRPYRSLGSWYMWRLIESTAPIVIAKKKT